MDVVVEEGLTNELIVIAPLSFYCNYPNKSSGRASRGRLSLRRDVAVIRLFGIFCDSGSVGVCVCIYVRVFEEGYSERR